MRFLNSLAKAAMETELPRDDPLSAYRLHADLFASGLERILLVCPISLSFTVIPQFAELLYIRLRARHRRPTIPRSTSKSGDTLPSRHSLALSSPGVSLGTLVSHQSLPPNVSMVNLPECPRPNLDDKAQIHHPCPHQRKSSRSSFEV